MLAGQMKQVSGGVGRNIADALGRLGHDVCFLSAVANDSNGNFIFKSLGHITTDRMEIVGGGGESTSWCVVLQNQEGDCMACIGDMECHRSISIDMIKKNIDALYRSPLVVIDSNICVETMEFVIEFCNQEQIPVYFETTDVALATKPFVSNAWKGLSFISPNFNELRQIENALKTEKRVDYNIIVSTMGDDESDVRIIRELIVNSSKDTICKLMSHVPVVMVTLGNKGLLFISKLLDNTVSIAHYPPNKIVTPISASGAGDCLCAGYISGILQGESQEKSVTMGLRAAELALLSQSPVPKELNVNY